MIERLGDLPRTLSHQIGHSRHRSVLDLVAIPVMILLLPFVLFLEGVAWIRERLRNRSIARRYRYAGDYATLTQRIQAVEKLYSTSPTRIVSLHGALPSEKPVVHAPPGWGLHRISAFLYSPKTFTEVFEPVLADMQFQYFEALAAKQPHKATWIRIRGYWTFFSHVVAQLPVSAVRMIWLAWKSTKQ